AGRGRRRRAGGPRLRRAAAGRGADRGAPRPSHRHELSGPRHHRARPGQRDRSGDHRGQLPGLRRADEPPRRPPRAGGVGSLPARRVIAVDGPAASGKTTLACRLAAHFGLPFLDTGLLYRAVAWKLLQAGKPFTDSAAAAAAAATVRAEDLDRTRLRSEAVSQG